MNSRNTNTGSVLLSLEKDFSLFSHQEEKTDEISGQLSGFVFAGLTILLRGDLGSGKTAFTRGLCHALGARNVRSPSFTIINEYEGTDLNIAHIDLYRIEKGWNLELDINYYLSNDFLVIIEWPQRLSELPGEDVWHIRFEFTDVENFTEDSENFSKRKIFFNCQGMSACRNLKGFMNHIRKGQVPE